MTILNYSHKGLKQFALNGSTKGIQPCHAQKVRWILNELEKAETPHDITPDLPIHCLAKGRPQFKGLYAFCVNGNYRIVFRYDKKRKGMTELNYVDYH